MKITFELALEVSAEDISQVCVTGDMLEMGGWMESEAMVLEHQQGQRWEGHISTRFEQPEEVQYNYLIRYTDGSVRREFGEPRIFWFFGEGHTRVRDTWRSWEYKEVPLFTSPFKRAFFRRKQKHHRHSSPEESLTLQVRAPRVGPDFQVGVLGSCQKLGMWDERRIVLMDDKHYPVWECRLPLEDLTLSFEYKYVIYSCKEKRITTWETGDNRVFSPVNADFCVQSDEFFRYPVGDWKGAGVAIPVFSLRTKHSAGVGDFGDLKLMIDWAVKTGLKVIQLLPVNDTMAWNSWMDSYPYSTISVHALHPLYLNMKAVGALKDGSRQREIEKQARKLNKNPVMDYEAVIRLKMDFLRQSFVENKAAFLTSEAFRAFHGANYTWLDSYAAFSCLRDQYGTPDFSRWGQYATMTDEELPEFVSPATDHYPEVAFYYYIQFHLDRQLRVISEYGRAKGVVLKGDIPIGVFRFSVETWRRPNFFHLDQQTGAPPDDFDANGQNWGFPTYNWKEMAKDRYMWWKTRMIKMSEYFDVFRIDHILGFFRIWQVPENQVLGYMGSFDPCLPVTLQELSDLGIQFDYDRFCRPYITRELIQRKFEGESKWIIERFLEEDPNGLFHFRKGYNAQQKVRKYVDQLMKEPNANFGRLKDLRAKLYGLHGEVLFFPVEGSKKHFSPRIDVFSTYSFQQLDEEQREKLAKLYFHFFYERHNDFWKGKAREKLPAIQEATDMLICGEDLGMVPTCVPELMEELAILSLGLEPVARIWEGYIPRKEYWGVSTPSTHDTVTLREWWEADPDQARRIRRDILQLPGDTPLCDPEVAKALVMRHLRSGRILAIFPFQDLLAMNGALRLEDPARERINIPSVVPHYWRYRMHLNLEDLIKDEEFCAEIQKMVDEGGRKMDY